MRTIAKILLFIAGALGVLAIIVFLIDEKEQKSKVNQTLVKARAKKKEINSDQVLKEELEEEINSILDSKNDASKKEKSE